MYKMQSAVIPLEQLEVRRALVLQAQVCVRATRP